MHFLADAPAGEARGSMSRQHYLVLGRSTANSLRDRTMAFELHYNVYGCFRDPRADIDLAVDAADAGFEGVWIGDHFLPWLDSRPYTHHTWPWFGALMNEVPDVTVGTSVTCPMLRYRPPLLAQAVATLDNMYPGRLQLGVGTGEALNEAHFLGDEWPGWETRAEMMVESIDVMRSLWQSEEYVSFDGDHFQYDGIKLFTRPKAEIDVHWAAWGPRSCRYAGEHADHLLTASSPDKIRELILPNLRSGLDRSGRDLASVDVSTELTVNIGDPEELVEDIRERGEFIPIAEVDNPDPRDIQTEAHAELARMSDEEIRDALTITEHPDEVIDLLERYEDAGATRVIVGSVCGDPRETIEAFSETILPHFG